MTPLFFGNDPVDTRSAYPAFICGNAGERSQFKAVP
jgi:hypothetical protein